MKRYDISCWTTLKGEADWELEESPDGQFVEYSDVIKLIQYLKERAENLDPGGSDYLGGKAEMCSEIVEMLKGK